MDIAATVCFVLGALFTLVAGVGVVRFDDIAARLHAAAKAPVLGLILTGIGVMLAMRTWEAVIVASLVITLQVVASPVGSHLLARSIYHRLRPELDGPDELAVRLEADEASPSADGS